MDGDNALLVRAPSAQFGRRRLEMSGTSGRSSNRSEWSAARAFGTSSTGASAGTRRSAGSDTRDRLSGGRTVSVLMPLTCLSRSAPSWPSLLRVERSDEALTCAARAIATLGGSGIGGLNFSSVLAFLAKRGDSAELIRVQVTPEFATRLRGEAVDQRVGQLFHGRPQAVAAARAPGLYGIPKNMFDDLLQNIVLGTFRDGRP